MKAINSQRKKKCYKNKICCKFNQIIGHKAAKVFLKLLLILSIMLSIHLTYDNDDKLNNTNTSWHNAIRFNCMTNCIISLKQFQQKLNIMTFMKLGFIAGLPSFVNGINWQLSADPISAKWKCIHSKTKQFK